MDAKKLNSLLKEYSQRSIVRSPDAPAIFDNIGPHQKLLLISIQQ